MNASFCPRCGRPRAGQARFCNGCGRDFGDLADRQPTAPSAYQAPPPDPQIQPASDPGWPDQGSGAPNPFAAPVPPPPSQYQPRPAPVAPRRRSAVGSRAVFILVVLLVAVAAGGGAYALVSRTTPRATAGPSPAATITAPASAGTPASLSASSSSSPTPTAAASVSPSNPSPTASARPGPTQAGVVRVPVGLEGNPAAPKVEAFLNRYFDAINSRNYDAYNSLLDASMQQGDSQSTFESGYATTRDSDEQLASITATGGGDLTVGVQFTSHQSPADSIDDSPCNNWGISLFLVPQGNSYLMTSSPSGYQASHADC